MIKNKKAQLQMGENVVVLFIFFFLLVFAVMFYAKIQKSNIESKSIEMEKLSSIDLKTLIMNAPELKCVEGGDVTDSCIDVINIRALSGYWDSIKGNESDEKYYYKKRFGNSNITVRMFDPISRNWTKTWNIYTFKPNNTRMTQPMRIPISLYNPLTNDYDYGELIIDAYYTK